MKIPNILAAAAIGLAALIVMASAAAAQLPRAAAAGGSAHRDGARASPSPGSHSDNDDAVQGINSNARIFGDDSNTKMDTSAVSSSFGGKGKALNDASGRVA